MWTPKASQSGPHPALRPPPSAPSVCNGNRWASWPLSLVPLHTEPGSGGSVPAWLQSQGPPFPPGSAWLWHCLGWWMPSLCLDIQTMQPPSSLISPPLWRRAHGPLCAGEGKASPLACVPSFKYLPFVLGSQAALPADHGFSTRPLPEIPHLGSSSDSPGGLLRSTCFLFGPSRMFPEVLGEPRDLVF